MATSELGSKEQVIVTEVVKGLYEDLEREQIFQDSRPYFSMKRAIQQHRRLRTGQSPLELRTSVPRSLTSEFDNQVDYQPEGEVVDEGEK